MPNSSSTEIASTALAAASERAISLVREIERLQRKPFAFAAPKALLAFVRERTARVLEGLQSLHGDEGTWDGSVPVDERLEAVAVRGSDLLWVHEILSLVDKVDSARIPFEIVWVLESVAQRLLDTQATRLILQPVRSYNYRILDLAKLFKARGGLWADDGGLQYDLLLTNFPSSEPQDILLHGLFLHELCHPLFDRKAELALDQILKQRFVSAVIAPLAPRVHEEAGKRLEHTGFDRSDPIWAVLHHREMNLLWSKALRIAGNWLKEIFCDVCALRMAGPAFVCSLKAFLLPMGNQNASSHSHPELSLRLANLQECLQRLRTQSVEHEADYALFGEHLSLEVPSLDADVSLEFEIAQLALQGMHVGGVVDSVLDLAGKLVPDPCRDVPGFVGAVTKGVDEIAQLVPPDPSLHMVETLESAALLSYVLHVCWLFKLGGFDRWANVYGWSDRRCNEVLNALAMKALEAGELRRRYEQGRR